MKSLTQMSFQTRILRKTRSPWTTSSIFWRLSQATLIHIMKTGAVKQQDVKTYHETIKSSSIIALCDKQTKFKVIIHCQFYDCSLDFSL